MKQGGQSARQGPVSKERITPAFRPLQKQKLAPCQAGCANCGDIRGWIGVIAQRSRLGISRNEAYERAWRIITDVNPFPSTLGRVCPHPCESHCNRAEKDEPLAINAMERFLGDWAIEHRIPLVREPVAGRKEWMGVIGAGPSGLSFAYQMRRRGYRVTVYEKNPKAGGMLRYGVPDFRLPQAVLEAEIEKILDLGVELALNFRVGRDVSLDELRNRHDALYLGIGAQSGRPLEVPGEEGPSVFRATEFLEGQNCGFATDLGREVLVVGGGNSAVDAARCARRGGARVTILYRRTREEMPASRHELEEALEEGVQIAYLVSPVRIERNPEGDLEGLVVCRMRLGEPDDSGRRRPAPMPGSEFMLRCDSIISAVSQQPELVGLESLDNDGKWLITDNRNGPGQSLLAGGDATGTGIAGNAIVQGRRAAELLHARFSGEIPTEADAAQLTITAERVNLDYKVRAPAAKPAALPANVRVNLGSAEVVRTLDEKQFLAETERCFSCGSCFGCEQCSMYCTTGCFTRLDEVSPGAYFSLMLDQCHECGKCIEVCPCGFLEVV